MICKHGITKDWCSYCKAEEGDEGAKKMLKVFDKRPRKKVTKNQVLKDSVNNIKYKKQ